jgi:hypothetical protein
VDFHSKEDSDGNKADDEMTVGQNFDKEIPDSELSRDYSALYSSMPLSDVELEVEGKVLKAHKNILWGMIFN